MSANSRQTRISKSLSWLLRHGAHESGLKLTPDGFATVEDVLRFPQFKQVSVDDIREVVAADAKTRYTLREDAPGALYICANQGHSIKVENLLLTPITSPEMCPQAVHGTFSRHLASIKEKGLLRMSRNHIHFSREEPSDDHAVSGIRPSCDVLIYLNVEKVLADGISLFESANKVVLSPGDAEGCIPPEYFAKIVKRDRKHGSKSNKKESTE